MEVTKKIVKSLKESRLLIKGVSKKLKWSKRTETWIYEHVIRYIRCWFIMKSVNSKIVKTKIPGQWVITACQGTIQDF